MVQIVFFKAKSTKNNFAFWVKLAFGLYLAISSLILITPDNWIVGRVTRVPYGIMPARGILTVVRKLFHDKFVDLIQC